MKAARGVLTARGGYDEPRGGRRGAGWASRAVAGVSAVAVNYETQTMTVTVYDDVPAGPPSR